MLRLNVNLKIRLSFEFGNAQSTIEILWKYFYWSSLVGVPVVLVPTWYGTHHEVPASQLYEL